MVCKEDWEPRQPQDFVRARIDIQAVPWSRPEPADSFVGVCTTFSAVPGYAVPGCATPGSTVIPDIIPPSTFIEP